MSTCGRWLPPYLLRGLLIASSALPLLCFADGSLPAEVTLAQQLLLEGLLGRAPMAPEGPGLIVRRQEWGAFRVGRAITETPLRIVSKTFSHGLGTHAPSQVLVRLPGPGRRFEALVGVNNGPITGGVRGSVVFSVLVGERELARTGVLKGPDAAQAIAVDLEGATELILRTETADDGPDCDLADWADARVVLADGTEVWLDELPLLQGPAHPVGPAFSFTCDGQPSAELLAGFERTEEAVADGTRLSYRDPRSGLRVTCTARSFPDFPAVHWVLEFENTGSEQSPLLERVLPLDLDIAIPPGESTLLRRTRGSTCQITDFLPEEEELRIGDTHELSPAGGRSSNGTLPFFDLDWASGRAVVAVGWSGQWAASISRPDMRRLHLTAGQQSTHFRLQPGERIRSPRILVAFTCEGGADRAHNRFRRLMLTHYCPRVNGELSVPPISHPTANAILQSGHPANEQNQMEMLNAAHAVGAEVYWLDAYWFPGGFPGGVGTWIPRPADFPRGLRPLSDAAHAAGMRFCLWFEPERVARSSTIAQEHPEFCLQAGGGDMLYNLADPKALQYMTDLLSTAVAEHGVDIYREDFNIDPLPFWQAVDTEERRGLTEAHWVEGLYTMWDELSRRKPGLVIDNCASGGRRIDLETVSRAYALWRSDFQDIGLLNYPNYLWVGAIAGQVQTVGLGPYAPFSTAGLYAFDPYTIRSAMCSGAQLYMDLRAPDLDRDQARAAVAEVKELRPYFQGDLYPLVELTTSPGDWCAYQLDRPEQGDGIALYFRREQSPYLALEARLRALQPEAAYEYTLSTDYTTPAPARATGAELSRLPITMHEAPSAMLLRYRKVG